MSGPHADPDKLPPGPGYRTIAKMEGAVRGTDPGPGVMRVLVIFKCPTGCGAVHDHNVLELDASYS